MDWKGQREQHSARRWPSVSQEFAASCLSDEFVEVGWAGLWGGWRFPPIVRNMKAELLGNSLATEPRKLRGGRKRLVVGNWLAHFWSVSLILATAAPPTPTQQQEMMDSFLSGAKSSSVAWTGLEESLFWRDWSADLVSVSREGGLISFGLVYDDSASSELWCLQQPLCSYLVGSCRCTTFLLLTLNEMNVE